MTGVICYVTLIYLFQQRNITIQQRSILGNHENISYVTMDSLNNYVSIQNAAYMMKLLIESPQYNYLVIATNRKFIEVGHKQVKTVINN